MINREWVDFAIASSAGKDIIYNRETFETMLKDVFEAVEIGEDGVPTHIWTKEYVTTILPKGRFEGLTMTIAPRNPNNLLFYGDH